MKKKTREVLRKFPEMIVSRTKHHIRITDPMTGDFTITSCTPSGSCYQKNLHAALNRLRAGCGFLERARRKRNP